MATEALLQVNRLSEESSNLQRDLRINMDPYLARSVDLNIVTLDSFGDAVKERLVESGVEGGGSDAARPRRPRPCIIGRVRLSRGERPIPRTASRRAPGRVRRLT